MTDTEAIPKAEPAAASSFDPKPTFPPQVEALVRDKLRTASVYLEYGSGASTVLAAELGVPKVTSVESDMAWAANMQGLIARRGYSDTVDVRHADIGPTRRWGKPVNDRAWKRYSRYPLEVWEEPGFVAPDIVLIDGRFRVGCLLATLFKCTLPTLVLFDDYSSRPRYHEVEEFVKPVSMTDRMALFEVEPTPFPTERMGRVMELFLRFT